MLKLFFKLSLFLSIIFFSHASFAQENNVFSRFGMGDLRSYSPSYLRGWGGLSAAHNSMARFNIDNPAALGNIGGSIFDFAANGNVVLMKSNSSSGAFGYSAPEYMSLAIPLKRMKAGLAFGLQSFTRNNYNITQNNDSSDVNAASYNTYVGQGGTYKVFMASGMKLKNFSFGLKANYVFGTMNYVSTLVFPDSINGYNSLKHGDKTLGDFLFEGGLQYKIKLKSERHLDLGICGNLQTNLNATQDLLFERFLNNGLVNDTVYNVSGVKGVLIYPMQYRAGILYTRDNKFSVGAQFSSSAWSNYSSFGEKDSVTNTWKISSGLEWIPNAKSMDGYFNRVSYRFGIYSGINYVSLNGKSLTENGITLGFGFPIRHSSSELNLNFDISKIGSLNTNNFQEYYFRGTFAFSLNDFWFIKRKYD